ncbi:MAG: hypothetical protein Q8L27_04745, partial [archaeon]|nr:hypothetical protein [archaeon]
MANSKKPNTRKAVLQYRDKIIKKLKKSVEKKREENKNITDSLPYHKQRVGFVMSGFSFYERLEFPD